MIKNLIGLFKDDPKEAISGFLGFAALTAICFMIAGIGV